METIVLRPKEGAKFVATNSTNVKIKESGIEKLGDIIVEEINSGRLSPSNFTQVDVHPKSDDPNAIAWIFVVDTLNFCFWHNEDEEGWKIDGYTGYFALCAAINRAIQEQVDILNPTFYSVINEQQMRKILRSDTKVECPLLSERIKCLHEVGNVLLGKYEGSFENVVKASNNSAVKLLDLITSNFKCFRDESLYKGKTIGIYKRAQILIGDIWACFKNQGIGYFQDIDQISAFADYRVPQTLMWFEILSYEEELLEKLKSNTVLENGSKDEVEIRACTLHAVELLREYVQKKVGKEKINSILIDHFLWDFRRKHAKEVLQKGLPFHKTFSIYY